jgi:hypothetical protein
MKLIPHLALLLLMLTVGTAASINVEDGSIVDWGLDDLYDVSKWGKNESWVPDNGIIFVVEDNNDPGGTLKYASGVHIKGVGGKGYVYNPDPPVNGYVQPVGGEPWDVEALYITEDSENIYVLIITSLAPDAQPLPPGDLALDLDNDGTYEYGVKIVDPSAGMIYNTTPDGSWINATDLPSNSPALIDVGNAIPTGNFANVSYFWLNVIEQFNTTIIYPNYAIEIKISKAYVDLEGKTLSGGRTGHGTKFHYSEASCGNDIIEQEIEIPEFSMILIPVGIVFGFYYLRRRENQ